MDLPTPRSPAGGGAGGWRSEGAEELPSQVPMRAAALRHATEPRFRSVPPFSKWRNVTDAASTEVIGSQGAAPAGCAGEAEVQLLREMQENLDGLLVAQELAVRRFLQRLSDEGLPVRPPREVMGPSPRAWAAPAPGGSPEVLGSLLPLQGSSPRMQEQCSAPSLDPYPSEKQGPITEKFTDRMTEKFTERIAKDVSENTRRRRDFQRWTPKLRPGEADFAICRAFYRLKDYTASLEEPERAGRLARLERSPWFEMTTLSMIMINVCLVVFQIDRDGREAIRDPSELQGGKGVVAWELTLEIACSVYFMLEVGLRLIVHRLYFFCNTDWFWDILDFVTVVVALVDYAMASAGLTNNANQKYLRFLRGLLRMTRSLRVFRSLTYVRPLRQILACTFGSMWGVFWCLVLITFATVISATFVCQCVTSFIVDGWPLEGLAVEDVDKLRLDFGSVQSASFSLFESTSGGNWGDYYRVLCHTGFLAPAVLILYILFFLIAAWNVITSLFLEKTLALSQPDVDKQLMDKRQKETNDAGDLMALMQHMDQERTGTVSLYTFKGFLAQPHISLFLESRDIDVKDAEMFFQMLQIASNSQEIALETLVNGLMRMRGVATNMDLQTLQFQIQLQNSSQSQAFADLRAQLGSISHQLHAVGRCETAQQPSGREGSFFARHSMGSGREQAQDGLGGKLSAVAEMVQSLERRVLARLGSAREAEAADTADTGLSEEMLLIKRDIDAFLPAPKPLQGGEAPGPAPLTRR